MTPLDWTQSKREAVPLSRLRFTATSVRIEGLMKWHAASKLDPIRLVERAGDLFLFDGHHRAIVAMFHGHTYIEADVLVVA